MSSNDDFDFEILVNKDLTDYNDAGYLPQDPAVQAVIQTWLSPTKYDSENSEYRKHVNSYLEGTCQWFEKSRAYQEWHENPTVGALWVKAVAGAGKSVLAASTAARLAREEQVPVLFFFFRQIVALNHEPKYLVRDWLSQLLPSSPWLQNTLKKYVIDDKKDINTISIDELWRLACDALSFMPKAYCIADALDEMDHGNEAFLQKLIDLGKQKPASIKLLLTSRPVPRVENILRSHVSQIRLDPDDAESDIDMYVEFRLKPIGGPPTFYETLKPIICARAQGLFLYARLVSDELVAAVKGRTITPADIPKIVESVPESLEDVYNKMLLDHSKRSGVSQEHQLTILQWVTHTTRPLRLIEAAAVMKAIGGAGESLKETKALVRAACGPLLEVLEDETLSVIHHSFTEYLTQKDRQPSHFPIITHEETHRLMATTCVKYLCSGPLSEWTISKPLHKPMHGDYSSKSKTNHQELSLKHPLLEYAMSNWNIHTTKSYLDESLLAALDQLFQPDSDDFKAYVDINLGPNCAKTFTLIHIAAWAGVAELIRHLIKRGEAADEKDDNSRTPISLAASRGHVEAVEVLLESGADPDSDSRVGWRPIHYAARENHHKVVKVLLNAGVSAITTKSKEHPGMRCGNAKRSTGETAVEYASTSGHTETFKELMPYLDNEYLNKALHWAASHGRSGVVAAILESPDVDVDHRDKLYNWQNDSSYGYTAVFQAAKIRDPTTMRLLLEKGASTSMKRLKPFRSLDWGVPPREEHAPESLAHFFCGKGKNNYIKGPSNDTVKEAFDLLVKVGCNIDEADETGRTPLHYACSNTDNACDYNFIINLLLNAGADASKLTGDGESVLHLYSVGTSFEVLNALVKHGADVNAVVTSGHSAGTAVIHTVVNNYHEDMVLAFLEHKPDVNIPDRHGKTALHLRASRGNGNEKVLKKLLELGADVNARDVNGETPLHCLSGDHSFSAHGDFAQLFIDAGADLEAKNHAGRTLLTIAMQQYHPRDAIETALKIGGDINVRDIEGRSVCHLAIIKMEMEIFELLIEKGADPFATDNYGNTLLHTAAMQTHHTEATKLLKCLEFLVKLGISPKAKNHRGFTPLHIATGMATSSPGYFSIFDFFIDPKNGIDPNEPDNYGVKALHLAASISEPLTVALLNAGADPYTLTYEDQSALHIAAKGRNSNIVGLLAERYRKDERRDFINTRNKRGETALHSACRSGRPESVRILIEDYHDLNNPFHKHKTPLHACAEILEERAMWRRSPKVEGVRRLRAANFMLNDVTRPGYDDWQPHTLVSYGSTDEETELLRIREIVRLLVARGADYNYTKNFSTTSLSHAVLKGCEPMIQELFEVIEQKPKENDEKGKPPGETSPPFYLTRPRTISLNPVQHGIYTANTKAIADIVKELTEKVSALGPAELSRAAHQHTREFLLLGHDKAAIEFLGIGKELSLFSPENEINSVVHWLVSRGYADIVSQVAVGAVLEDIRNCDNYAWAEEMEKEHKRGYGSIKPVLPGACSRRYPNLDTIKVLVEELGLDINAQLRAYTQNCGKYKNTKTSGPLHILAAANNWWQLEALEYLLQRKADTEIRNETGQTPLHIALKDEADNSNYRNVSVALLLKYGSDTNTVDDNDRTCLDYASESPHLIRLLAAHGANIKDKKNPPLVAAVCDENVEAVRTLLELGADVNAPLHYENEYLPHSFLRNHHFKPRDIYPLFLASTKSSYTHKVSSVDKKTEMTKLLLEYGANPYQVLDNKTTVIHQIFEDVDAITEPFITRLNALDLERRSPTGRTLLLSACLRHTLHHQSTDTPQVQVKLRLLQFFVDCGADVSVTDNDGKGVLHHLLESDKHYKMPESIQAFTSSFIISNPSLISHRDKAGYTPLHYAFKNSNWGTVRVLVDTGADLFEPDPDGNTALHFLVCTREGTKTELFEEALAKGDDINGTNNAGRTPLWLYLENVPLGPSHWAAFAPSAEQVSASEHLASMCALMESKFLANGADIRSKDNEGKGLLHVIAKRRYERDQWSSGGSKKDQGENMQGLFRWFVAKGLDPWAEDEGQLTALDVAAVLGNEYVLKLFRKD
jgi:ankyrin repeat protein